MGPKIKLEVNHGKHQKKGDQSGAKLTLKETKLPQKSQESKKQQQGESTKKQQKKGKKQAVDKSKDSQKQLENSKANSKQQQGQQKPDAQLATIQRVRKTKDNIEKLIAQYKDSADDIFANHGHNPEKQMKIEARLSKLQKEHAARRDRLKKLEEKSLEKQKQKQEKREEKFNLREEKIKQKRRKRAQQKLQLLKSLSQERLEKQQKYKEYYNNEYKAKIPRYQRYLDEFLSQQKQHTKQQMQNKVMSLKKKYAPIDLQEINNFEEDYNDNKWTIIQENQKRREQWKEQIENENNQLKAKLWRGRCHKRVEEQRKQREKKKNEGKTKLEKTKQYGTIIKTSFPPKVNVQKREMSLNMSRVIKDDETIDEQNEYRYKNVAREKYFQGKNKGLVVEKVRQSLDTGDKIKKGNQYLQYVVNLPKREDGVQSAQLEKPESNQKNRKRKSPTFKLKKIKNPYYAKPLLKSPTKFDNPQSLQTLITQINGNEQQMKILRKDLQNRNYSGILEVQDKHNSLNKKLASNINKKLDILDKI